MHHQIKITFLFLFLLIMFLTSCGYQKMNSDRTQIHLENVSFAGENYIGYQLKNNILLLSDAESKKKI